MKNSRHQHARAAHSHSRLSRRGFLLASGACAVGLGIVGNVVWDSYRNSRALWVEQVVRRNLPGVALDAPSLATFVREILAGQLLEPQTHRVSVFAQQATPWITARIPKARSGLEKLERRVLTEYLIGSNFFRINDPKSETIFYYGPAIACGNPFVTFT